MHNSTFIFVTIFGIGFFHLLQASPIGHVGFSSTVEEEAATTTASNLGTTELAVTTEISESTTDEVPRPILNETAVIDTLTEISSSNETHIRAKRSCGCGCCCCRPCCCCCCKPCCCCCCQPCCCCCRCCCCRCCCCRPCCCCCCRPCCCCGGCGCCGCGGGRRKRSLQNLTHKLMNKQASLLREESTPSTIGYFFSTTTAPVPTTTTAIYTNAQIDAFGRSYANLAFADFTNNDSQTQYFYASENEASYDQQQQ